MKKFKDLFEAPGSPAGDNKPVKDDEQEVKGYKPRSKGEQDFANMHMIDKRDYYAVPGQDHVFNGTIQGNPDDHVGGKTQAGGERSTINQGSSQVKPSGAAFKEPKQHGRPGEKAPVKQGSSKITEEYIAEGVVDTLKDIVKTKGAQSIKFKNGRSLKVDMQTANLLLKVHEALKPANAKKFRDSLEKGPDSFMKMLDFANSVTG
jgi:hypothetical protein